MAITKINLDGIHCKCSTQTLNGKINDCVKKTQQELFDILPGSCITKFRNCVISKKIPGVCIKLYTNLSLQINGIINNKEEICNILNNELKFDEHFKYNDFLFKYALRNWAVVLSDRNINLDKTLENINKLNNKDFFSFFFKGKPLHIKYTCYNLQYKIFKFKRINSKYEFFDEYEDVYPKKLISISLFNTGKCVISGINEEACAKVILELKKYLVENN